VTKRREHAPLTTAANPPGLSGLPRDSRTATAFRYSECPIVLAARPAAGRIQMSSQCHEQAETLQTQRSQEQ
jgi:hypothetical protein